MTNKNQFLSVIDDEIDIMSLFRDALLQIDLQLGFAEACNRQKTVTVRYKMAGEKKTAERREPTKRMKPNKTTTVYY